MKRALTAVALCGALVAAGCGGGGSSSGSGSGSGDSAGGDGGSGGQTKVEVVQGLDGAKAFDAQAIYKAESPGVVTVISIFGSGGGIDDLLGGGGGSGQTQTGEGTGVVLNGRGEIATNAHVVASNGSESGNSDAPLRRASQVYVAFNDGNRVAAKIVGYDPDADVALLKIDPSGLTLRPIPLGDSDAVKVGEPVAAIGSPFGREQSLSVGVVSAVDRSVQSLTSFQIPGAIQTDAAINPGNSGGPLINAAGRVIGLNEQIATNSGGGEGVGFAVPINLVKRSVAQLRENGRARYAYLGVSTVPVYPQLAEKFDLGVRKGAWIQSVVGGGPGADAGLKAGSGSSAFQGANYRTGGDVITKINGRAIADPDALSEVVARYTPGTTVTVTVHRDGADRDVKVKLAERPSGSGSTP
jgi:S1-C subfamily serine protease